MRELVEVVRATVQVRSHIQHENRLGSGRNEGPDRGSVDSGENPQFQNGRRHHRARRSSRDEGVGLSVTQCFQSDDDGAFRLAAHSKCGRFARFNPIGSGQEPERTRIQIFTQTFRDARRGADQEDFDFGRPGLSSGPSTSDRGVGSRIAPQYVQSDSDHLGDPLIPLRHSSPGP